MAASLAATAAANAQQQKHAVRAAVQVCLRPDEAEEGRALPELQQPFLICPANMQIGELTKVSNLLLCAHNPKAERVHGHSALRCNDCMLVCLYLVIQITCLSFVLRCGHIPI